MSFSNNLVSLFGVLLLSIVCIQESNSTPPFSHIAQYDDVAITVSSNKADQQQIDPTKYLATLYFHTEENFFPITFDFRTTRNVEDNIENYIKRRIGKNIYSQSREIKQSQANDQCLAVYFHHSISRDGFDVYEYWYYYAGNDWINKHEHDWECYSVYELNGVPKYIRFFVHQFVKTFNWAEVDFVEVGKAKHPKITVTCGSHAMGLFDKQNCRDHRYIVAYYDGTIGGHKNFPEDPLPSEWIIYSNDDNVTQAIGYEPIPDTFYYGDRYFGTKEYSNPRPAPWKRHEWGKPPSMCAKEKIRETIETTEEAFNETFIARDSHELLLLGTFAFISNRYIRENGIKNRLRPFIIDTRVQEKLQINNERRSFRQRYGYILGIISLEYLTACVINILDCDHEIKLDRTKTAFFLTKACLYSISISEIANFSGNTSLAFIAAYILSRDAYQVCREITGSNKYFLGSVGLGAYIGAVYVGYSAMRHGEDHLSDVLVGAIVGLCIGNRIYSNHMNDVNEQRSNTSQKPNTILSMDRCAISLGLQF